MFKKFIMIPIILLVSIVGILGTVKINSNPNKETYNKELITNSMEDKKTSKEDIKDEDDKNDKTTKVEEEIKTPIEEEKVNNHTSTNNNNKSNNSNTNSNTSNASTNTYTPPKEETKVETPTVKTGPWDAWGMSESEYYNDPYPKGARVDYKVGVYGSEDACMNACTAKGDELYGYIYSCDRITSASGKFLGVMLDIEKVN